MSYRWFFFYLWILVFLVIKIGGTALHDWSWWWILFPLIPDLSVFFHWMGVMG